MPRKIEISHRTIIFTVLFLAALWILVQIRGILFFFFIAFIFMSALRPMVDRFEKWKVPRGLSILLLYIIITALIGVSLATMIPSITVQFQHFAAAFPSFIAPIMPYWNVDLNAISQQVAPIGQNIVKITVSVFSNVIGVVTVLMLTFYLVLERKNTGVFLESLLGEAQAKRVGTVLDKVERRLGSWVLGQLFLMIIIGVLCYIGLTLLRVSYALPLAIIAALFEIIPNIGPILSSIPAVLIALTVSPLLALSVGLLYFIIHQAENTVVVPFVMKQSVGLPPLITILSLMVGGELGGIGGAVLAVPLVLVIQEIIRDVTSPQDRDKK